jgi:hypothetical protein
MAGRESGAELNEYPVHIQTDDDYAFESGSRKSACLSQLFQAA